VFPLDVVPVHWIGKLEVICEQSAFAMERLVEPCPLRVLTVAPFTVKLNELLPHTSLHVWPEQIGSIDSPPAITAVP